ncbi:hypothetical protein A2U01_0052516, partial [Trifolium medium]|nr:hypothetical protein [Trifolium medium]
MVTDGDAMVTDIVDGDETLLWSSRYISDRAVELLSRITRPKTKIMIPNGDILEWTVRTMNGRLCFGAGWFKYVTKNRLEA